MGRPRKIDTDDRYSEDSLNLNEPLEERDPEGDDLLAELGERKGRAFDRLSDAVRFGDGGY